MSLQNLEGGDSGGTLGCLSTGDGDVIPLNLEFEVRVIWCVRFWSKDEELRDVRA